MFLVLVNICRALNQSIITLVRFALTAALASNLSICALKPVLVVRLPLSAAAII